IIMSRLAKACPTNPRQRGFIRAPGCLENVKLLQILINNAKKEHRELGVVFVDIAKAFDTVIHDHILMGLNQKEVDTHIINLIKDGYTNTYTHLE
ncbi:PO21 protein, partial [Calyptomena viridis]|nr:PO21 protein [Calyptomena viridis]